MRPIPKRTLKIVVGILVVAGLLGIGWLGLMEFESDWQYDAERKQIDLDLVKAGFTEPSSQKNSDFTSFSPDGTRALSVHWDGTQAYHWEIKNKQTGMTLSFKGLSNGVCDSMRANFLWSPDSHYLTHTEFSTYPHGIGEGSIVKSSSENMQVIEFTPAGLRMPLVSPHLEYGFGENLIKAEDRKPLIIDEGESTNDPSAGVLFERSKALRWLNATDLLVIVYVEKYVSHVGPGAPLIAILAHETLHFSGDSYVVTSMTYDFYRKFYDYL